VIDVCGDKDVTAYTKADANGFRDNLIKRGLTGSSITRIFGTVRSVINFAASEVGIDITNPFGRVYYDRNAGVEDRATVPIEAIRMLQAECRTLDDDLRWLVALVSDTGMRLAEAAGMLKEDLKLDEPIPHVVIREHPWRRLKTAGSARKVPLVGMALWAARRVH
jgi:integrase